MIIYRYACGHRFSAEESSAFLAPAYCLICKDAAIVYPGVNDLVMWAIFDCGHQVDVNVEAVNSPKCLEAGCPGKLLGFTHVNPQDRAIPSMGPGESLVTDGQPGRKFDGEKPAMDLMPPLMELEVCKVLTFGAQKYDADNWRRVPDLHARYRSAAKRHINALRRGELYDEESGCHHAAHAVCCLMFMGEIDLEKELEGRLSTAAVEEQTLKELEEQFMDRIDERQARRCAQNT